MAALLVIATCVAAAVTAVSVVHGLHKQNRTFAAHLMQRPSVLNVTVSPSGGR